jgi:hypothetical protein
VRKRIELTQWVSKGALNRQSSPLSVIVPQHSPTIKPKNGRVVAFFIHVTNPTKQKNNRAHDQIRGARMPRARHTPHRPPKAAPHSGYGGLLKFSCRKLGAIQNHFEYGHTTAFTQTISYHLEFPTLLSQCVFRAVDGAASGLCNPS